MDPLVLSIAEARRALSPGSTKLYELIAEKKLESVAIGRKRVITTASVRKLVADLLETERSGS